MAVAEKVRPTTFKKMLKVLQGKPNKYFRSLKTAIELGWFTDGLIQTKLTEEEQAEFKEEHGKNKDVKAANVWPVLDVMPKSVSLSLEFVPETDKCPAMAEMATVLARKLYLQADLYLFLVKRHPKAIFYLSKEQTEDLCCTKVVLSERTAVALLLSMDFKS